MAECPNCERYKNSASLWRNVAYRVTGYPLPWSPDEQLLREALEALERLHYEMFTHQGETTIAALKARLEEK